MVKQGVGLVQDRPGEAQGLRMLCNYGEQHSCGFGHDEPVLDFKKIGMKGKMVGARGFEPPASWSRTRRSTKLSHAPTNSLSLTLFACARYNGLPSGT